MITALSRGSAVITCTTNEGGFTDTSSVNTIGLPIPPEAQNVFNGATQVVGIYNGTTPVEAVYSGDQKVYPAQAGYVILTDDTRIEFSLANTPIENFCGDLASRTITVNGNDYLARNFREIYFGTSYNSVSALPNYFLRNLSSLQEISLLVS